MKTVAQFQTLSFEDRQKIFELCEAHPYEAVLLVIARPRSEGGFDFRTSYSTLRRFYITFNPRSEEVQTLEQYAESLQICHQHADGAFQAALLTHVETRLLQALKNGRPIAALEKEFKILARLHRSFRDQEEMRRTWKNRELNEFVEDCNEQDRAALAVAHPPTPPSVPASSMRSLCSFAATPPTPPPPPSPSRPTSVVAPSNDVTDDQLVRDSLDALLRARHRPHPTGCQFDPELSTISRRQPRKTPAKPHYSSKKSP